MTLSARRAGVGQPKSPKPKKTKYTVERKKLTVSGVGTSGWGKKAWKESEPHHEKRRNDFMAQTLQIKKKLG